MGNMFYRGNRSNYNYWLGLSNGFWAPDLFLQSTNQCTYGYCICRQPVCSKELHQEEAWPYYQKLLIEQVFFAVNDTHQQSLIDSICVRFV